MLAGEDDEKGQKKSVCLISQKTTFERAANYFLYISFPLFYTTRT